MSYPLSIDRIHDVVKDMQKFHFELCDNLPEEVSQEMANLTTSASLSSVSKRFHILAAKELGMIDTPEGVRMSLNQFSIASTGNNSDNAVKSTLDNGVTESSSSENQLITRKRKAIPFHSKDNGKDSKRRNIL